MQTVTHFASHFVHPYYFSCKFITYDVVSFARHWAELHLDNEADRQFLREIKMDIVSVDAITQNT